MDTATTKPALKRCGMFLLFSTGMAMMMAATRTRMSMNRLMCSMDMLNDNNLISL